MSRWFTRRPRRESASDGVVAERNGARLVRKDGRLICECPFLCYAASEPCEFRFIDSDGKVHIGTQSA